MGRQYAAMLGTIAFTVVMFLAIRRGAELGPTLETAFTSTMVFCGIGYGVGIVAEWIVRDSIREEEIEARCAQAPEAPFPR